MSEIVSRQYPGRVYDIGPAGDLRVTKGDEWEWEYWCVGPVDWESFTVDGRGMRWSPEKRRLIEWYARYAEEILERMANK